MAAGQSWSSIPDSVSRWVRGSTICVASGALLLLGCSEGGEVPPEQPHEELPPFVDPTALRLPFLVDEHFVPNGCFGDNNCQGEVIDINSRACVDRPASAQGLCRRYRYDPMVATDPGYAGFLGILFQDVGPMGEQDIGLVPGVKVEAGAKRVVFWAAVAKGAAPVLVHFRAGGANNWDGVMDETLPYHDTFGVPLDVTVTPELTQYQIDVSSVTYDTVVSPFGWAIKSTSGDPIDLFIDDVRWE